MPIMVSQGASAIQPNLLILGGTSEATALAGLVHAADLRATISYAGRVAQPARQPVPRRIGGFGGVEGLVAYLRAHEITHLVDATHPFAAQMSAHAVAAAAEAGVSFCALTRPPWQAEAGDRWQVVADTAAAVRALEGCPRRVMLGLGRLQLGAFAAVPQHFYLLRLVDPPADSLLFPHHHVVVARGPFETAADKALLQDHRIDVVVSKNAGGSGAYAKIAAARALGLPVIMIDRPALPPRRCFTDPHEVIDWVHAGMLRGV
jgi:precorrin-6A/cobalt-precorrin-6A reductase